MLQTEGNFLRNFSLSYFYLHNPPLSPSEDKEPLALLLSSKSSWSSVLSWGPLKADVLPAKSSTQTRFAVRKDNAVFGFANSLSANRGTLTSGHIIFNSRPPVWTPPNTFLHIPSVFSSKNSHESLKTLTSRIRDINRQCCGSGSGIRCLFDPWIPDLGSQTHIFRA